MKLLIAVDSAISTEVIAGADGRRRRNSSINTTRGTVRPGADIVSPAARVSSGTVLAHTLRMPDQVNGYRPGRKRGWLIAGVSLALLFGVALLKGRGDSGGGLDSNS